MENPAAVVEAVLRLGGVHLHPANRIDFLNATANGNRISAVGLVLVHDTFLHTVICSIAVGIFSVGNYSDRCDLPRSINRKSWRLRDRAPGVALRTIRRALLTRHPARLARLLLGLAVDWPVR
jgi:hypothetical protein